MSKYKYTILAVDDEVYNLESIQRTFHGDYHVIVTTSPSEALEIFRRDDVDLVIADQRMPQMLGTELLEKMKNISPLPIRIVLSAYTDLEYLMDAINRGEVYRYITKPWTPEELRVTVKNALDYYQALRDRERLTQELAEKNILLEKQNKKLQKALKELEAAQQKLLEMERFSIIGKMAGMIIHDLKQPLDIIRSAAETIARMDIDEEDRLDLTDMIKEEVQRFLELIQELLEYSRGTLTLQFEIISLSDFWGITEHRLRSYIKNYEVNLRILPVSQEAHLKIDIKRMQRAIINLIRNSVEAFREAKVSNPEIILEAKVVDDKIEIILSDNGPGVPEDIQEKIFTPFVTGKKPYGIGLGLPIVQKIVQDHNGTVSLAQSSSEGTTFVIELPRCQPENILP